MQYKKGSITTILIIIGLFIVFGGGIIFTLQKNGFSFLKNSPVEEGNLSDEENKISGDIQEKTPEKETSPLPPPSQIQAPQTPSPETETQTQTQNKESASGEITPGPSPAPTPKTFTVLYTDSGFSPASTQIPLSGTIQF